MFFACDIGGTKTRIAWSNDSINFEEPLIFDTFIDLEKALAEIKKIILEKLDGQKMSGLVLGLAGTLDETHSQLLRSTNLPSWQNFNIKEYFEKDFGPVVFIENDTELVGLGEYYFGEGKGFTNMVYVTISTGIGGVKIVDGEPEKNKFGFEPGHMIMNAETNETWEDLASGKAIQKKFNMHPKEIAQTDKWVKIEEYIYEGLHNVILHWSPDILVVGGSMSKDLDENRLKEGIAKVMKTHPSLPEIKIAKLDAFGGIYGGFAYLKNKLS